MQTMQAYQIVDLNNPTSVEYAALSKASFQPAIDEGILGTIIDRQCVTPNDPDFAEKCAMFTWHTSKEAESLGQEFSDTEKARMISHFELLKEQRDSMFRFIVMEHDAWLRDGQLPMFKELMGMVNNTQGVLYGNLSYKMSYYSVTPHFAGWAYSLLTDQNFPINTSLNVTLARLFATYTVEFLAERNFMDKDHVVLAPWKDNLTLGFARDIYMLKNNNDPDPRYNPPIPVTQVVKRSLSTTVDTNYLDSDANASPWTRHEILHVID